MFRWERVSVGAAALAAAFTLSTGAAQAAVDAHGSAEQVYATGLAPGAKTTLLDGKGRKVAARKASALGGVVYRDVKPGSGYRLATRSERSEPVTVLSTQPAPPNTSIYDQEIAP